MSDRAGRWRSVEFGGSGAVVGVAIAVCVAFAAGILVGRMAGTGDFAGERRTLDARAFELTTRALVPGSALACLDASATETIQDACEKALFASPESTAAAVSYVASQVALLAAGRDLVQRAGVGWSAALAQLRRSAELDRFGIVAHVLSVRDGCTAEQCDVLAMLGNARRVRANLASYAFEAKVQRHAAGWNSTPNTTPGASPQSPAVSSAPGPAQAPVASAGVPNNYFLPSSSSIPAVSIMNPEPTGPQDAPGVADSVHTQPRRASQARTPANPNAAAGSNATPGPAPAPMSITPPAR